MIDATRAADSGSGSIAYRAVVSGGLVCGVLDLTAAFVTSGLRGASPERVLQYIASGLLGPASFNGGLATASLGVLSHFTVAFGATLVFYMASRKLRFMTERAIVSGVIYGIAVYFFMSRIVVPLSAAPRPRFSVSSLVIGLVVHVLCVGLPISLAISWYSKQPVSPAASASPRV